MRTSNKERKGEKKEKRRGEIKKGEGRTRYRVKNRKIEKREEE
jgi:hypothetical protein